MNYLATVEIEFETTDDDPLETLQRILNRTTGWGLVGLSHWERLKGDGPYAEHYHILQQPREMP